MNHTATIELSFSIDGRELTQGELDAILTENQPAASRRASALAECHA